MKRILTVTAMGFVVAVCAFAQADQAAIDKALMAAPGNLKKDATVIKWKSDYTYDTLRQGTNALVCYDESGLPGEPAFKVECTMKGNLARAAQNLKFESITDQKARQTALESA